MKKELLIEKITNILNSKKKLYELQKNLLISDNYDIHKDKISLKHLQCNKIFEVTPSQLLYNSAKRRVLLSVLFS